MGWKRSRRRGPSAAAGLLGSLSFVMVSPRVVRILLPSDFLPFFFADFVEVLDI